MSTIPFHLPRSIIFGTFIFVRFTIVFIVRPRVRRLEFCHRTIPPKPNTSTGVAGNKLKGDI